MLYDKESEEKGFDAVPDFAMQPAQEIYIAEVEKSKTQVFDETPYNNLLEAVKETLGEKEILDKKEILGEKETMGEKAVENVEENIQATTDNIIDVVEMSIATVDKIVPVEILSEKTVKTMPVSQNIKSSIMNVTDIKDAPKTRLYLEEDVLVPDVKPDLLEILSMDGKIKLAEREIQVGVNGAETIKAAGDLVVQTLYIPEGAAESDCMIFIESRIPFKGDYNVGAAAGSQMLLQPQLENLKFTRINERKFKVKATILLCAKEYKNLKVDIFEGIYDDNAQMLKEKIHITDVAIKKTEDMEVREEMEVKENQPNISKILKYDVNLVENNKQFLNEKAVINGSIYCNILYLGCISEEHPNPDPTLYQGKADFTHFIKLNTDEMKKGDIAGGKAAFNMKNFSLTVKETETGEADTFSLEADIETTVEIYRNVEKEVVTDIYHSQKELEYETEELCLRTLAGSGNSEVAIREIVTIPDNRGPISKVAYISADIKEANSVIDEGRNSIEGIITAKLICMPGDIEKVPFAIEYDIPYRTVIEIPGMSTDMTAENTMVLKALWFDKIGDKQVEINGGISINTVASGEEKHYIVKSVNVIEGGEFGSNMPALVLYITRAGDNIWKIAKKFRTTIDAIKEHNPMDYSVKLVPGTKLLIETKPI